MNNAGETENNSGLKTTIHSSQEAVSSKNAADAGGIAPGHDGAVKPSTRLSAVIDPLSYYSPGGPDPSGQGRTGAQIFAALCKEEGLTALFCAAGNYHVVNAIAEAGIPCYGGRTEGGMCAAADGFARVTGDVVACSATEGPGLTHMIMNIACAHFSNSALLVLASNSLLRSEDCQRFIQFMFQQPLTEGLKKYGKRITVPERIYEYGAYAFRNLKSGVPDVVHLDFPAEIAVERFPDISRIERFYGKEQYRTETRAYPGTMEVRRAIEMIDKAERPVLIAGHGVFVRKACDELMQAAETHEMAVVGSGPVRGHFPDDHRLSGSMSNEALMNSDLVVFVGQYSMPNPDEWTLPSGVKTIRVHPVQEDIGRNWPVDLGIVSDEKVFMEALANGLPAKKRDSWMNEIAAARSKWESAQMEHYAQFLKYSRDTERLHPFVLCKEVHDFLYKGNIDPKQTVTGWGGNMIGFGCMRWLRANRPGQEVTVVYQFGPMGPDLAMMMGPAVAVQRGVGPHAPYKGAPVVVVTGDAGMAYSLMELDTFVKYKLPVICIVYNNDCWGTFPLSSLTPEALHLYMFQENLRYDKMAEHLGVRGEYIRTPEELRAALNRSYDAAEKQGCSTLINCQGIKEFNLGAAYPPDLGFAPEPGVGAIRH